jgi:serine/threonine protein kinase
MSDSALFEAEQHIGQYEVLAVRGVGEHGVVYQVKHDGASFALKAPHPRWAELDRRRQGQWATRLVREFQILNSLHHPCLVPAYAVAWHRGMPFFTMEFLRGSDAGRASGA